jgi:hypothetical protein
MRGRDTNGSSKLMNISPEGLKVNEKSVAFAGHFSYIFFRSRCLFPLSKEVSLSYAYNDAHA